MDHVNKRVRVSTRAADVVKELQTRYFFLFFLFFLFFFSCLRSCAELTKIRLFYDILRRIILGWRVASSPSDVSREKNMCDECNISQAIPSLYNVVSSSCSMLPMSVGSMLC